MAAGFARSLARPGDRIGSAGSRPGARVHPEAIAAMAEVGIDLSGERPKGLFEWEGIPWDVVVTMGCGDVCPFVPARGRLEWVLPDPKGLSPEAFREIRDEIGRKVSELFREASETAVPDPGHR